MEWEGRGGGKEFSKNGKGPLELVIFDNFQRGSLEIAQFEIFLIFNLT